MNLDIEEIKRVLKLKIINFKKILIDINNFKFTTIKHRLIIYFLLIPIYLLLFLLPNINYLFNKIDIIKYDDDSTSCMLHYVDNYYPNGAIYYFENNGDRLIYFVPDSHIDGRIDKKPFLKEVFVKNINGCLITDNFISFVYNSPYCALTLMYEKGFKLNRFGLSK